MVVNSTIDLGQIIIATLIAIVGWFVKREINSFNSRLDRHEIVITKLSGHVQNLMGRMQIRNLGD